MFTKKFDIYCGNNQTDGFYYISSPYNYDSLRDIELISCLNYQMDLVKNVYLGVNKNNTVFYENELKFHFDIKSKILKIWWNKIKYINSQHKIYIEYISISKQRDLILSELLDGTNQSNISS